MCVILQLQRNFCSFWGKSKQCERPGRYLHVTVHEAFLRSLDALRKIAPGMEYQKRLVSTYCK